MSDNVDQLLDEAIARRLRPNIAVGQVLAVEASSAHGYMVDCQVQPSGARVLARVLHLGAGPERGDFVPVQVDAEVLLLFPGGDRNRAVAIAGLTGGSRAVPSGWENSDRRIVEPGGVRVTLSDGAAAEAVVLESLLPDLQAAIAEITGLLKALGLATPNADSLVVSLATDYRSASLSTDKGV